MVRKFSQLRKRKNDAREKEYEKAREQYLQKLEAVAAFADVKETKAERILRGERDAIYFGKTYLPHYFSTATQAEWHPECIEAANIKDVPTSITGPRGGAKSTFVSFLEIVRDFCYGRQDFIVLTMDSLDRAELYTLRILTELQHNPRIKEDFGLLVSMNAGAGNFGTRRSLKRKQTRLMAWGDGMSMRGLVSSYSRPTKIVIEDVQDREAAESEKRTKKLMHKIKADWFGAKCATGWIFTVLGNVICSGSVIDRLQKEEKHWKHFKFLAERTDGVGKRIATWPELFPLEKLDKEREHMGDADYEAEYLCEPRELNAVIQPESIRHWQERPRIRNKRIYLVLDPSLSELGDNKALFAMAPWKRRVEDEDYMTLRDGRGKLYTQGLYHVIFRCWNRQATMDELFQTLYEWDELFQRPVILYDGTFGQKRIMRKYAAEWAIKMKRRLRLQHYILKRDKDTRVAEMAQDIDYIILPPAEGVQEPDVKETVKQLVRYGKPGVKKDGPDAIAAGIEKSDKVSRPGSVA